MFDQHCWTSVGAGSGSGRPGENVPKHGAECANMCLKIQVLSFKFEVEVLLFTFESLNMKFEVWRFKVGIG